MSTFYLYGLKSPSNATFKSDLLATFDSKEQAEEYVKLSKLVKPSVWCEYDCTYFYFRKSSLLREYFSYKIIEIPNNPTLIKELE